ncbi:glycosyltransferase [Cecembia calidifontis]|jgi:glycosyltransferase involved in cell wall biosynthesis|uniref:Glycosyltransferase involved in cell wall biosynthesis n=1 Tax=Cecembia calidifontis TaxID=1187080 RepID=A0A4Q7P9S1_9BACT|nr:glycosyltransferase [Cecembia calidifontis]RZS96983.1 glycosyltransferase involved in cell wall biosynthesis [Cecembia calidifontis]
MKVLLLNDYPMDSYYNDWEKGITPGQQLWGKTEIDKMDGIEMIVMSHEENKFLKKLGNLFLIQHLDLQLRALKYSKEIDAYYSPFGTAATKLLLILRVLGFLKTPIVVMVHYPLLGMDSSNKFKLWLGKKLLKGYDRVVFLSRKLKQDALNAFKIGEEECKNWLLTIDWGSETSYYKKFINEEEEENYAVSNGQTDRDFDTLIEAFRGLDLRLKIFAKADYKPKTNEIPSNVEIFTHWINNNDLCRIYNKAKIVLVCFKMTKSSTLGLTSLFDSMSMGKAVIITENPYIDIDVEKEGVGFIVKEGDVETWKDKINILLKDPNLRKEMGKKGLELQNKHFSLEKFGLNLFEIFKSLNKNDNFSKH